MVALSLFLQYVSANESLKLKKLDFIELSTLGKVVDSKCSILKIELSKHKTSKKLKFYASKTKKIILFF